MFNALSVLRSRARTVAAAALLIALPACSTNPATGDRQFAALMSPAQEAQVGASEHQKIMQMYGTPAGSEQLQAYITRVGNKVAANTERPDVQYQFFLLDDPVVNAFALPGGYVYVTRGLLAQANSEAELAAVLGHEIGHITGRHSAERYSQSVVTGLGAAVLAAAIDSNTASQAIGLGSDLFLKSYSRGQENQADELGIRYINRAGYDASGMTQFLRSLDAYTGLEGRMNGTNSSTPQWFSTHPLTADRVQNTVALAAQYPQGGTVERDQYMKMIDGLVYGDSEKQGFVRGNSFYHTQMDFTFSVPQGFKLVNQPDQVIATGGNGAVIIFDAVVNSENLDALTYLTRAWMSGQPMPDAERITVNGKQAATASFAGSVNNVPVTIRVVAIEWKPGTMFRFQLAMPRNASGALVEDMKRTTYSLRPLSASERQQIRPYRLQTVTAGAGDTVASLARRMPFSDYVEERFRTLNALGPAENVVAGRKYKIVTER